VTVIDVKNIKQYWKDFLGVKRKGVDRGVGGESGEFSLMLVVAPVVAGMAFVSLVGIFIFISMARKKRSLHGTYSPQKQEYQAPRLELKDLMIKVPQEERLI